jgi:hypothetical protein
MNTGEQDHSIADDETRGVSTFGDSGERYRPSPLLRLLRYLFTIEGNNKGADKDLSAKEIGSLVIGGIRRVSSWSTDKLKEMDAGTTRFLRYATAGSIAVADTISNFSIKETTIATAGLIGANFGAEIYSAFRRRDKPEEGLGFSFKRSEGSQWNSSPEDLERVKKRNTAAGMVFIPAGYFTVSNAIINLGSRLEGLEAFWDSHGPKVAIGGLLCAATIIGAVIKSSGSGIKRDGK